MVPSVLSTVLMLLTTTTWAGPAPRMSVQLNVRSHTANVTIGEIPQNMVALEGGSFTMGVSEKEMLALGEDDSRYFSRVVAIFPQVRVDVDPFVIDAHEVTNLQYKTFLDAKGLKPSPTLIEYCWSYWDKGKRITGKIPPGQENNPVRGISYHEALDCARWLGKRLPTEEEWEFAGRHRLEETQYYPWDAKSWDAWDKTQCANVDNSSKGTQGIQTSPVGSWKGDQTPDGIFDLCGNVVEWTSSVFNPYPGWEPVVVKERRRKVTHRAEFDSLKKVIRGGSIFGSKVTNNLVMRFGEAPTTTLESLGFRCAMSGRPGEDDLRDGEASLALLNAEVRGAIDFGPEAMVGQQIHYIDPNRGLTIGNSTFAFAPVKKLKSSWNKVQKQAKETPALVAIFTSSRSMENPKLPPGEYAVFFKAKGESKAQKEARKAAADEKKEGEEEEPEEEEKEGEPEPPPEETPEERAERLELLEVQRGLEKIGAAPAPRISLIEVPTDRDVLQIYNGSGDLVAWVDANLATGKQEPTRFTYSEGDANAKGMAKAAGNAANAAAGTDLAEITFVVEALATSRHPKFTLKLEFPAGAFSAVTPPVVEEDDKKKRRRRR